MSNGQLVKGFLQSFEVKDIDLKSGTFIQAYTRYDVKDSDGDYGRKGMFSKTWKEHFPRIRHILNHKYELPVGEPKRFYDDDEYAYIESQIGTHDLGEDFKKMVDSGLIKEASYGYNVIKSNKLKDGSQELLEVKLWEVSSLTGWGANQFTPVIAFQKGLSKDALISEYFDKYAALEKFCHNSTATDATLQQLEIEKKQIKDFLIELYKSTEAAPALQPQEDSHKDDLTLLDLSIKTTLATLQLKQQWK